MMTRYHAVIVEEGRVIGVHQRLDKRKEIVGVAKQIKCLFPELDYSWFYENGLMKR